MELFWSNLDDTISPDLMQQLVSLHYLCLEYGLLLTQLLPLYILAHLLNLVRSSHLHVG